MKFILGLLLLNLYPIIFFNNYSSTIEWNQRELCFDDFRANPKESADKIKGEFIGMISWRFSSSNNEPPKYTIYNKMDTNESWMSVKHEGLLSEYQFMWDLQELYARKMRKAAEELNNLNEQEPKVYRDTFYKYLKQLQADKNRYKGMLHHQPDFNRILNQQYQDSLKIYDQYKLK